ncbi:MAG: hypothetical protein ACREQI_06690 [Candidatus Binataceae bacterium]
MSEAAKRSGGGARLSHRQLIGIGAIAAARIAIPGAAAARIFAGVRRPRN